MKWVIQTNIYHEDGFDSLLSALDRLDLEKVLVKVVPFEGRLEPIEGELPAEGADAIVMGSYTLARVAQERKWRPGAFLRNLNFEVQKQHWGALMLNHDAIIDHMYGVPMHFHKGYRPITGPFFIRPVDDSKAFTGYVTDPIEFEDWIGRIQALEFDGQLSNGGLLTSMTKVMLCKVREIFSETRVWVIEGKVVTASGYKIGHHKQYSPPEMVDRRITDFAEEMSAIWRPNEAFVMDVADTPFGLRIVEVNNLNSAGWYKGDVNRIVQALEAWASDPSGLLW